MKAKPRWREDLNRWEIRPTIAGKRVSIYGRSPEEAELKAAQSLRDAEIVAGASPSYREEPTLREFAMHSYLPIIAHRSTAHQESTVWSFGKFLPALGHLGLSEVKRPQIQRMLDDLTIQSKSDVKADLHAVLELAVADGLIPSNPAKYVKLPRKHQRPRISYSAEELARLIVASRGMVCHNAIVLACMGVCRGECLGVKWPIGDTIRIHEQNDARDLKNQNRYREIPVPAGLVDELEGRKQGYVVECRDLGNITGMKANPAKKVRARGFHKVKELAGMKDNRTFHDIRHSVSTLLVRKGCHIFIKDAILGHVKQGTSARYTDYTTFENEMRTFLEAVFSDIRQHIPGVISRGNGGTNAA